MEQVNQAAQDEVDKNYEEFLKILPSILQHQRDRYALMRAGKIIGFFSSAMDARTAAKSFIPDGLFSIQRVTDMPVELGYFSRAVPLSAI